MSIISTHSLKQGNTNMLTSTSLIHPNTQLRVAGAIRKAKNKGYAVVYGSNNKTLFTIRYGVQYKTHYKGISTTTCFRMYQGNKDVTETVIKSLRHNYS